MTIMIGKEGEVLIESILGNETKERVLLYLHIYGKGHGKGIADTFAIAVNGVQQQLKRLEEGGVIVSQFFGRTRVYQFNPQYPFLKELRELLSKVHRYLPDEVKSKYYMNRTRPRRAGKPLR